MAQFRCPDCGHTFSLRSHLAELSPCPVCEETNVVHDAKEPEPPELAAPAPRDPVDVARRAAAELLAQEGITQPPVDVEAIAESLGLAVEGRVLGDVSGELRGERIVINREHHRVRQRFTIAHELGHHRLHTSHSPDGGDFEREANAFAAALLVPASWLRRAAAQTTDFEELRRRFDVSGEMFWIAIGAAGLSSRFQRP